MSKTPDILSSDTGDDVRGGRTACWYAVHTRSNYEKRVAAELGQKQVAHYLPLVREIHRWRDRRKQVELPLFPGYVFVCLPDCAAARLAVVRTSGAVRILGFRGCVEPIPHAEITGIQRLLAAEAPCLRHPFLRQGAQVRVRRGPLKDLKGLLARVKNQNRLVLTVHLLAQSVATEVDLADIEIVHPQVPLGRLPKVCF